MADTARTPLLLWPFAALIKLLGRIVAGILGLVLMVAGVALTMTVLGAPVGVPMFIFGLLLTIRSLF
jgi:hypothetical protein